MPDLIGTVRQTLSRFCIDFVADPYLCYTEHGLHALFYTQLFNALPEDQRYATLANHRLCILQKEYPTAGALGKPRRQHWDIAVVQVPPQSRHPGPGAYDYLALAVAIEFGMNEAKAHLVDDIQRLSHAEANVAHAFVVHLYRLSTPGARFSSRDGSPRSPRILSVEQVASLAADSPVEVYYAMHDSTGKHPKGAWRIRQGTVAQLV